MDRIKLNRDAKFDLQLGQALIHERQLADIFKGAIFERGCTIELKTESYQWRRTGNIAIEFRRKGKPSGISVTKADLWVHELCDDDGKTLMYLMWPIERLKKLCREAYRAGQYRTGGGDGGEFDVILIRVADVAVQA